ncbi:MAG: branched-chain amino acid ABC transporter permease [Micromonosporaceae bacterium]|nr:branched-chain amino acid ABC transporter permease [Micromonosporaceae bacterium]
MSTSHLTRIRATAPTGPPRRIVGPAIWATAVAASAGLPWLVDGYTISLASNALILALLAASTHLVGIGGLPSFGQTAYLAAGGYTAALLAQAGTTGAAPHLAAGILAGVMLAVATAPVVLRTRGVIYLMITFAVGQLAAIAVAKSTLLGGDEGLTLPPMTVPGLGELRLDGHLYLCVLAVACPLLLAAGWITRTQVGLRWRAIADHEPRLAALGGRTTRDLLTAHLLAAGIAGAAGALLADAHRYIGPADLGMDVACAALLACAVGRGRLTATITAAVGIVAVRDLLGAVTSGHATALLGAVFVLVAYQHLLRRAPSRPAVAPPAGGRR